MDSHDSSAGFRATSAPAREGLRRAVPRPAKPRALVVEDDALIALALVADLTALGCEVAGRAASGEAAVELASRHDPDIVILDVHLAGALDGVEAATRIQRRGNARIVFVTAHADGPQRRRMEAVSPAAILGKPYDAEALAQVVQMCLARRWARDRERAAAGPAA